MGHITHIGNKEVKEKKTGVEDEDELRREGE